MRDAEHLRYLEQIQTDLDLFRERAPIARRNISSWSGRGYPSSSMPDSSVGSARGTSDPVGLEVERGRLDRMRLAREEAEATLIEVAGGLARLVRFAKAFTERLDASKADPECKWCAQVGRYSAPFADELCRWHYDFRAEWGIEPHREITLYHLNHPTSRMRSRLEQMMREYHPHAQRRSA